MPVESVLPVAGCDPGTVTHFFPLLANGPNTTSVIGKTGTLTNTDGGVAVLAGFARTGRGELFFCVAVPNAAGRLKGARRAEEQWVLDFLAANGGGQPHPCARRRSDAGANIILLGDHVLPPPDGTSSAAPAPQPTAPCQVDDGERKREQEDGAELPFPACLPFPSSFCPLPSPLVTSPAGQGWWRGGRGCAPTSGSP